MDELDLPVILVVKDSPIHKKWCENPESLIFNPGGIIELTKEEFDSFNKDVRFMHPNDS